MLKARSKILYHLSDGNVAIVYRLCSPIKSAEFTGKNPNPSRFTATTSLKLSGSSPGATREQNQDRQSSAVSEILLSIAR